MIELLNNYPIVLEIITYVGMLRLILKPLMSFLHEYVVITPSKKDDELLKEVEESKYYKWLLYVLDWVASIKIKK